MNIVRNRILIMLYFPSYDLEETTLQRLKNKLIAMLNSKLFLPIMPLTLTIYIVELWQSGIGRNKWKCSDSFNSDYIKLMTLFTTLILDFHLVISTLVTPTTTPSLSLSRVKINLWWPWVRSTGWTENP